MQRETGSGARMSAISEDVERTNDVPATRMPRRDPRRAVRALAHVEGKRLIMHPAFIAFVALVVGPLMLIIGEPLGMSEGLIMISLFSWPIAAGTMIATNLAVRRAARDDAQDLEDAASLSEPARTVAHLLSVLYAVAVTAVLMTAWVVYLRSNDAVGALDVAEAATPLGYIAGAGAIGVFMGRWVPWSLGWLAGLATVIVAQVGVSRIQPEAHPLRWLAPWVPADEHLGFELLPRVAGWHLLYLFGLAAIVGVLALMRRGPSRAIAASLAITMLVTAGAAFGQTRPLSDEKAAQIATAIVTPPSLCEQRGAIRVCVYPSAEHARASFFPPAQSVFDQLPAPLRGEQLDIRQHSGWSAMLSLPASVIAQLPDSAPPPPYVWPDDGAVHVDHRVDDVAGSFEIQMAIALRVALRAVGLPMEPGTGAVGQPRRLVRHPDRVKAEPPVETGVPTLLRCVSGGQARAVVALWLTGQATTGARRLLTVAGDPGEEFHDDGISHRLGTDSISTTTDDLLFIEPALWSADMPSPTLFAASDLQYANQMLQRPDDAVGAAVRANWDVLTDPRTPTSTLVGSLDLVPLPSNMTTLPFAPIEPRCT